MVPMIDLLMVTISFLLITAVWVRASRVEASAQAPGADTPPCGGSECAPPRMLHVDMRDKERFTLRWTEGGTELRRAEVPRRDVVDEVRGARLVRFPGLRDALAKEWSEMGRHREGTDRALDALVLHTDDGSSYAHIVGAIDAVRGVERPVQIGGKAANTPAFQLTFAVR